MRPRAKEAKKASDHRGERKNPSTKKARTKDCSLYGRLTDVMGQIWKPVVSVRSHNNAYYQARCRHCASFRFNMWFNLCFCL